MYVIYMTCPTCNEARYQSTKAFEKGGPPPTPADFVSLATGESPPIEGDKPPSCDVCKSNLRPELVEVPLAEAEVPSKPRAVRPVRAESSVTTCFEVSDGEIIASFEKITEGTILVVTNRRIVKVLV